MVTLPMPGWEGSPGLLNLSSEGTQNTPQDLSPMLSMLLLALPDGDTGMSHGGQPMGTAGMFSTAGGLWEAAAQTQGHSWHICFSPVQKQSPVLENGCKPPFLS